MTTAALAAIVRRAAARTVAGQPDAESNGDALPDLAWMLGGVVSYREGLTAFAAEVIRAHADARPTAEEVAAAVIVAEHRRDGEAFPRDWDDVQRIATAAARAGGAR